MEIVIPEEYKHLYVRNHERPIVKIPDPVLRKVCTEVETLSKKTLFLIDEMLRCMRKAHGVGLAAPQLGVAQRIIVIAPVGEKPSVLINPKVLASDGEQIGQEGCLSLPGLYGDVKRFNTIEVEGIDRKGREYVYELEGMPARIVQHELDHLDGILFTDKVDPTTLFWQDPDRPDFEE